MHWPHACDDPARPKVSIAIAQQAQGAAALISRRVVPSKRRVHCSIASTKISDSDETKNVGAKGESIDRRHLVSHLNRGDWIRTSDLLLPKQASHNINYDNLTELRGEPSVDAGLSPTFIPYYAGQNGPRNGPRTLAINLLVWTDSRKPTPHQGKFVQVGSK